MNGEMTVKNKRMSSMLFTLYMLVLVWAVIFKFSVSITDIRFLSAGSHSVNLIPFHYDTNNGLQGFEVLANVILFIPLGLYLKMFNKKALYIILLGLLLSFAFEGMQFLFSIGEADITDIITNTLGTAIGVLCYSVLRSVFPNKKHLDKGINTFAAMFSVLFGTMGLVLFIFN
ncbi:MAG: VanZ family protein [Clostridia bacterium]|nr:VanZ family protein [Clostridia bacterium]